MANFTDQPIQFNPYIETTPIQPMVAVGIQREQDYRLGLAKSQAYLDSVAGLDIIKEEDKGYVSSKLNEVKQGIVKNLSGDFSDTRIVNQIGGAASHIYKDPIVQNAVVSTANYRKGIADIEAARKAGKSDKNNEDYYYDKVNRWLTDKTPGTKFSDSFIEHTDIMKKIKENLSSAGLDSTYIEQMYETDARGNRLLDKNNHVIPALTMSAVTSETNARQVQAIVANVLKEGNVQQQIQVDGWANTRGIQPSSIYNGFLKDFTARNTSIQEQLVRLESILGSTKLSVEERLDYEKQKQSLLDSQGNNEKQLNRLKQLALENPDKFKQDYYQDNYVNNLLSGFTTVKEKKENKENPLRKQYNWIEEMNFKRDNENWNRNLEARKMQVQREQFNLTFQADHEFDANTGQWVPKKAGSAKKAVDPFSPTEMQSTVSGSPIDAVSEVMRVTGDLQNQAWKQGFDMFYKNLRKLNGDTVKDVNGKEKPLNETTAMDLIGQYAKARGQSKEEYIAAYMGQLDATHTNVPLDAQDVKLLENYKVLQTSLGNMTATIAEVYKQVEQETGIDPRNFKNELKPEVIKEGFYKYNVSVSDKVDYITVLQGRKGNVDESVLKSATDRLQTKFGRQFSRIMDATSDRESVMLSLVDNTDYSKSQNLIAKKFKKFNIVQDPFAGAAMDDEDQQANARKQLVALLTPGRLPEKDQVAALATLAKKKDVTISYIANRPTQLGQPWTGKVFINGEKGERQEIEVNEKELEAITGRNFKDFDDRGFKARASVSSYGSTNLATWTSDPRAWQTAAIGNRDFVGLKDSEYSAAADIVPLQDGSLALVIYYKTKDMPGYNRFEYVPKTPITDFNLIASSIPLITPAFIKQELEKQKK